MTILMVEIVPPVVISPSGGYNEVRPKNGSDFELAELASFIDDGSVELVYLRDGTLLVIDEDGKDKGLAYNEVATGLALLVLHRGDYIVGPALWCQEEQIK